MTPEAGELSGPPSALEVAAGAVRVGEPGFVEGRLHWISTPPDGTGGAVLFSGTPDRPPVRESPTELALRSRLYLYGAGAWCATEAGIVGIDLVTQQLGLVGPDAFTPIAPGPVTDGSLGDPCAVVGTSWVLAAAETIGARGAWRGLVALDVRSGARVPLVEVRGRCAEPQVDPRGTRVAWTEWPDGAMPWDAAEIRVASLDLDHGTISCRSPRRVDGGRGASSGLPTWRPDGSLAYVTEAAGHWQPWVCDDGGVVRRLSARRGEFQRPRWLTCRWLAPLGDDGALFCAFADAEGEHVAVLGDDGSLEVLDQPCVRIDGVAADADQMAWVGATLAGQGAVCTRGWPQAASRREPHSRFIVEPAPPPGPIPAVPEPFSFHSGGVALDGVLWRPDDSRRDAAMPLVVTVHPGPTGAVDRSYAPVVHLLTCHGFAVCAVDVSGSTAHGRAHRERLLGRFGDLDVAECVAAARHLVDVGVADPAALFIRGTSAGGTLALLALEGGAFRGAVAWYPASSLADADSGFEAGYLGALLGPGGARRSPLARAAHLNGSVLVVQGEDDPIVTPAETASLVEALRAERVDVEDVTVPGEGHGFRSATGRATALDAELSFYARHAPPREPARQSVRPPG
ncbi:MAG TPA: prolyl oligopeptidase family serine peptidase [Acidimicrobiales bacterium]|nr:prolyl oligopeptidase family serine peptidase [Acidimicrobiales bacterium]